MIYESMMYQTKCVSSLRRLLALLLPFLLLVFRSFSLKFQLIPVSNVMDGRSTSVSLTTAGKDFNESTPTTAFLSNFQDLNDYQKAPQETVTSTNFDGVQPDVWAWCVLTKDNGLFHHFPHAAEKLLPCWSWFQRIRSNYTSTQCGFYLVGDLPLAPGGWPSKLIEHMGCSVTRSQPSTTEKSAPALLYYLKNNTRRRFEWFQRPEDANALRTQVLKSMNYPDNDPSSRKIRITIIDRNTTVGNRRKRNSRRILNVVNISKALKETFPFADVTTAFMEGLEPEEQFAFWSQQDIIVIAHGAAITNAFFMPPAKTSALVELFPLHFYFTEFYSTLLNSSGIRGYGYYNNVTDIKADFAAHRETHAMEAYYRDQNLNPPVEAVVDLVRKALLEGGKSTRRKQDPKRHFRSRMARQRSARGIAESRSSRIY